MSVFSGDFLGFTIGNVHSSELNITRVSSGDRYEDNLLPSFKDTTMEVPGGDGVYYWDTFYNQRQFTLNFAYDDLRDEDLRRLRQVFSFKGVQQLIFDEFPYKKYMVKCAAPPNFKYICFDHLEMRLYKGEGSVNLVAYYPYALATVPVKVTSSWSSSSISATTIINTGDLPAILKVSQTFIQSDGSLASYLWPRNLILKDKNNTIIGELHTNRMNRQDPDHYILIDSSTHLIEGLDINHKKTGHLYNSAIQSGDFFSVPPGKYDLYLTQITNTEPLEKNSAATIEYTPLYY